MCEGAPRAEGTARAHSERMENINRDASTISPLDNQHSYNPLTHIPAQHNATPSLQDAHSPQTQSTSLTAHPPISLTSPTLHYTTLHYTTHTTLHYTTLHYATHYATPRHNAHTQHHKKHVSQHTTQAHAHTDTRTHTPRPSTQTVPFGGQQR